MAQIGVAELEEAIVVKKVDKLFGRVPLNASQVMSPGNKSPGVASGAHMLSARVSLTACPSQAASNRDSLAKILYNELFGWIRERINGELAFDAPARGSSRRRTVGLLDIFGFESFTVFDAKAKAWCTANSLEQLCINFANESLQMLFNQKVTTAPHVLALPALFPRTKRPAQVLESDKRMYEAEFEAGDLPEIKLDDTGYKCLANMDMVFSKLRDACREAERRDEYDKVVVPCRPLSATSTMRNARAGSCLTLADLIVRRVR